MGKIIKIITALLSTCVGLGFVISWIEKRRGIKGWSAGHRPFGFYEEYLKRPLDFGLSLFALLILWPAILAAAVLVRARLGSPVLFRQERPGLDGRIFIIRKFRTMTDARDEHGNLLPDIERLPKTGGLLRSTSIDELPELFNILRGDMAIVGPRPLIPRYMPYFTEKEKHRHDVRPGLTGLAQTKGRNALSWDDRLDFDVQYVDKITFLGDMRIVFNTVRKVLKEEDIVIRGTENSVLDFDVERRMKIEL